MSEQIGALIKRTIIPSGMTTAAAARKLGVGRQALHTLLSGKSRLSAEMAASLEREFGADAAALLKIQAEADEKDVLANTARQNASGYLKITSSEIEDWTDSQRISSRSTLPVLVRRLIHATTSSLSELDFHGDEDAERKGWDGEVTANVATAKVPVGKSGWELSSSKALPGKPTSDIEGRTKAVSKTHRKDTTFIFATGRRWNGKEKWAATQRASGAWKDVRAYDADDLAQWLEQSPATQIWFAERIGKPTDGVKSLGQAWDEWSLACDPVLPATLFEGAVERNRNSIEAWLADTGQRPLIITADSAAEGLAFLSLALPPKTADDTLIVSTADALRRTTAATITGIIVIDQAEVEALAGPYFSSHRIVIVRPKTSVENDSDIELEQLDYDSFSKAMAEMGFGHGHVSSYSAQSAQSATILRRLFARAPSLRRPAWAEGGTELAKKLIPVLLAGAWSRSNKTDCEIVAQLAGKTYAEVEEDIAALRSIPDSPVWAIGNYRGVICRRDALFAAHHGLLEQDIDEFLEWARLVLSEDDPSLDLEPDKRWSAGIYGKKREISGALRNAIGEMLILLAVYDDPLFKSRIPHLAGRVEAVVRDLMRGKTAREFLSLSPDFQHLAEASPSVFLDCIEADLNSQEPQLFQLLRSVEPGSMGGCDRTTLLWALELLAWDEAHYLRVIRILGRLSAIPINDNWVNKPEGCLGSLVSSWHPETTVAIEGRIEALKLIAKEFPDVGWRICLAQVNQHQRMATPNSRPTYRSIGITGRRTVTYGEIWQVEAAAWEILLNPASPTPGKFVDLIHALEGMEDIQKVQLVKALDHWIPSAQPEELAMVSRALRQAGYSPEREALADAPEIEVELHRVVRQMQPSDVVARHQWLFAEHYVPESRAELMNEKFDYEARERWIADRRDAAAAEVYAELGIDGIVKLLMGGNANYPVGRHLANCLDDKGVVDAIDALVRRYDETNKLRLRSAITGLLFKNGDEGVSALAIAAAQRFPEGSEHWEDHCLEILLACPFLPAVWNIVETNLPLLEDTYWRLVVPNAWRFEAAEYDRMIDRMLRANRPRAAFAAVRHSVENVDPFTLARVLEAIVAGGDEAADEYRIDGYSIDESLAYLHEKKALSTDVMARLEFVFIDALTHSKHGIPNLDRRNSENPGSFVELVALMYKRKDGGEDPEQYRLSSNADANAVFHNVYRVLDKLSLTPGTSDDGEISVQKLVAWVKAVQDMLRDLSREEIGDQVIGQLLGRCPIGADGIWPHEAVRMALEQVGNEEILRGMALAVYNSRGVVMRGPGGDQERVLAAKYEGWAKSVEIEYPFAAKLLNEIKDHYLRDAQWHDTDENVRKRLGRH